MIDEATGEEKAVQWYVKTEHGDIRGPMSQGSAEEERDRLNDSMVFSDEIFEPLPLIDDLLGVGDNEIASPTLLKRAANMLATLSRPCTCQMEPVPEGSEELLSKMRSVAGAGIVIPHVAQELLREAINAIVFLSRDKIQLMRMIQYEAL